MVRAVHLFRIIYLDQIRNLGDVGADVVGVDVGDTVGMPYFNGPTAGTSIVLLIYLISDTG
jgi:hypothetical protein